MTPLMSALLSTAGSMATSGGKTEDPYKSGSNVGKFLPFQLSNPYASSGGNSFLGRGRTLSNELLGEETQTPQYFTASNPFFSNVGIKAKGTEVNQPSNTGSTGGGK